MGKLSSDKLQKMLSCIKKDERVLVPPMIGYDAGVHLLDGKYVVVATDPCIGVPMEHFGWLLINYAASDVALFGAKPQFTTITLLGPKLTNPEAFELAMRQTCKAAEELEIAIVRGHTGMYEGINDLVGVCTVYGTVASESLITPANAKAGDLILCTKPVGLETITNFCLTHPQAAQTLFGKPSQTSYSKMVPMQSCVKEALSIAKTVGIHAMHDATEGGLVAALNELADASKVGFTLNWESIPIPKEAYDLKEHFKFSQEQILALSSTGTILAAVAPEEKQKVENVLEILGLPACFVGAFTQDTRKTLIKANKESVFPQSIVDPYTQIMESGE
jgi:hydrogenase expression/formation protein HypE